MTEPQIPGSACEAAEAEDDTDDFENTDFRPTGNAGVTIADRGAWVNTSGNRTTPDTEGMTRSDTMLGSRIQRFVEEGLVPTIRRKFDDEQERAFAAGGFIAGTGAFDTVATLPTDLWIVLLSAFLLTVAAFVSESPWSVQVPVPARDAMDMQRQRVRRRFGWDQKGFQGAAGFFAGLLLWAADDAFGFGILDSGVIGIAARAAGL